MKMRHLMALAAAVLATVSFLLSGVSGFDFYKLSLTWPPSACNIGRECIPYIPGMFTVHGLWPQYANDTPVPPYAQDPTCTTITPTDPSQIPAQLQPIEDRLHENWPSFYPDRTGTRDDPTFWRHEWEYHGMCSDYPNDTLGYFTETLNLAQNNNPLTVMGIQPSDTTLHEVKTILDAVKNKSKVYPQIVCNTLPRVTTLQLVEFRFCFKRAKPPSVLQDCPKKLAGDCKNETDEIRFPPAPPISSIKDEL
ncbi:ribonuclease 1-like [Durio zibethinus]|uniref:Ribonuclease 1-like n=1 Tax=Durio zibethinus TaxID=66656 RepID=A0A6P6AHN5_DURZI|nr:ribonuclease 1-like [Durio zibethinus]